MCVGSMLRSTCTLSSSMTDYMLKVRLRMHEAWKVAKIYLLQIESGQSDPILCVGLKFQGLFLVAESWLCGAERFA